MAGRGGAPGWRPGSVTRITCGPERGEAVGLPEVGGWISQQRLGIAADNGQSPLAQVRDRVEIGHPKGDGVESLLVRRQFPSGQRALAIGPAELHDGLRSEAEGGGGGGKKVVRVLKTTRRKSARGTSVKRSGRWPCRALTEGSLRVGLR
jgi:hypothetical protein